ncbi:MAG: nitrilase-related carbon-nitrogen hydrolase [Rhodospirillaceae bacterium]
MRNNRLILTRRSLLKNALGGGVLAPTLMTALSSGTVLGMSRRPDGSGDRPTGALSATLILSQERWSTDNPKDILRDSLASATTLTDTKTRPTLVVLPHGEMAWDDPVDEDDVWDDLAELAEEFGVYLAGSAPMIAADSDKLETLGFLFSPTGDLLNRTPKITPDFTSGFTDSTSRIAQPASFAVASTPFGKLALLPGEDILMPGLVRGAMLNGAEIILNPALRSVVGGASQAQDELPTTIAYENWLYVATATPATRQVKDVTVKLPTLTGLFDWQGNTARTQADESFVQTDIDIEVLRRARAHISVNRYDNYPLILRDGVYGPVYSHIAESHEDITPPDSRAGWLAEAETRIAAQAQRRTADDDLVDGYYALMAQPANISPLPKEGRRAALMKNITDALALVEGRARRRDSKLVVFPEFCFSGAGYRTVPDILSVAMQLPGPEMDVLSEFAQRHSIYIAAQALEVDEKFPNRVFNTAFLINDSGDLINKHRKVQCVDVIGALRDHTPGSIFEAYVEEFGIESLFSVADTPLGKIGHIICFEVIFPEILRLMTLNGAELLVQSTSEGWSNVKPMWHACRRKRAYENTAYLVMSNTGYDVTKPKAWIPYGESQVIDYRGNLRNAVSHNGPEVLMAYIDMAALRAARRDPKVNIPLWDEPATYAHAYNQGHAVPNELWAGDPFVFPYQDGDVHRSVQTRFYERGIYMPPSS